MSKKKPNKHRNVKRAALAEYISEHVQEHNFDRLVRTGVVVQER